MTGVILVVDDVPANVKLLEAKLTNEYYDVVTARDGFEAIEQTQKHKPDLILLDVMMPGMDGFETCRKIKADPDIAHIPIVMVTALSEKSDRLQGLESGADDFITKPINDTALFARVKSLVRMKLLIDELRLRDQSGAQMGVINEIAQAGYDVTGARVMVVDDDAVQSKRIKEALARDEHIVELFSDHHQALEHAKTTEEPDLIIISTMLSEIDGLRLATQFKAVEAIRHVPIITLVDEEDVQLMLKALELGVNDYLTTPVDSSEMAARVKTQLRRKKFQDALKSNYKESVSMAITDGLTGLYNRHYLDTHLKNLSEASLENGKPMSLVIMDMDHFKSVNDTYGHDVGDEVLKQLSKTIVDATRSSDLVARYGGEEFVVLMPETDPQSAYEVASRIRESVEATPFIVSHEIGQLRKTISIGLASLNPDGDTGEAALKRADTALYHAKNGGRNRVCPKLVNGQVVEDDAAPAGASSAPTAAAPPPLSPQPVAPAPTSQPMELNPQPAAPSLQPQPLSPQPAAPSLQPQPLSPQPAAPSLQPQPLSPQPVAPSLQPQPLTPQPAAPSLQPQPLSPQPAAPSLQPQPLTPQPAAPSLQPQPLSPQPAAPSLQPQPLSPQPAAPSLQPQPLTPQPAAPQPPAAHAPHDYMPLQPQQPAAQQYSPVPQTPSAPAAPVPETLQPVQSVGAGPNRLQPSSASPSAAGVQYDLSPAAVKPQTQTPKRDASYDSPIDDEPEGTF